MKLFGIGKENKETKKTTPARTTGVIRSGGEKKVAVKATSPKALGSHKEVRGLAGTIILRPHITEKSGILSGKNVYTFEVNPSANKYFIGKAIEEIYKVTPRKIAIAQIKPARKHLKNRVGFSSTGKKAYVYLKEGDKIEFI